MIFEPQRTVFVILSFEGPDVYSQAGGLGVRVKGLARSLAQLGYKTYLYFCGDPDLPAEESQESGRLVYRRWCQWISSRHRGGVYDGEEEKIRDWNASLPQSLIETVIGPAVESGHNVVIMGEEWHTSWSMNLISDALYYHGLRDRVVILWNANNTFGFHRMNWAALALAATITTVSRYMKFKVWERGHNPIVIPNGVPRESIHDGDPEAVADGSVDGGLHQAARKARAAAHARGSRAARRRGHQPRAAPGPQRRPRQRTARAGGAVGHPSPVPRGRRGQLHELRQRSDARRDLPRLRRRARQFRARAVRPGRPRSDGGRWACRHRRDG